MKNIIQENKTFSKVVYVGNDLSGREFDTCIFINCIFSDCNLTDSDFIDCTFEECDLSMLKFNNTGIRDVSFKSCKLIGTVFAHCRDFLLSYSFEKCLLDYSSFQKKKMKNTIFNECSIKEADFSSADLTGSSFINCDLSRSLFQQTLLEKVDFRSAINFSIDPEINRIKNARFSPAGIIGLLDKYQIKID